jgi:hypothetical protein
MASPLRHPGHGPPLSQWVTFISIRQKHFNVYQPIRDKVFAHTDPNPVVPDLFRDTLVGDIEDILHDLNKIRTAVFQLLENGRECWIEDNDRSYADPLIADARALLSDL